MLTSWWLKADALRRLGPGNVANVAAYRLALRLGIHPVRRLQRAMGGARFFRRSEPVAQGPPPSHWQEEAWYFGWYREPLGEGPPHWHRNPFTGAQATDAHQPWWQLSDFATGAGDIKTIWEASRFDWVLAFAQRAAAGGAADLERLNAWLADWCEKNPAYRGPNWKCGQEASIRVLHLLLAARLLGQLADPEPDLPQLIEAHLARIYPTLRYAMAQDNNHGSSEAAALFVGGAWRGRLGMADARRWTRTGRYWLENRAARLIGADGGFSQHSVNYHRLLLDTLSVAEILRKDLEQPAFSSTFYQRAAAATRWLFELTDPDTGDAPNLGANDGANLLPLTAADYRDYRPSVQLAAALFAPDCLLAGQGPHRAHLRWLGVTPGPAEAAAEAKPRSVFHARGYLVLRQGPWRVLFRYPHYRFRPGHCDALHVDLWCGSHNLLRDGGSYSYNTSPELMDYFTGPAGHNTVQFDDRDPMPSVSRFLRARWLTATVQGPSQTSDGLVAEASYRDWRGARHRRELVLEESGLRVVDEVSGFRSRAVLRWRLAPGAWRLEGDTVRRGDHTLRVTATAPVRVRLVSGWESRYYLQKDAAPVLEGEIQQPGRFLTEYRFSQ
jgi:hypothetical protein